MKTKKVKLRNDSYYIMSTTTSVINRLEEMGLYNWGSNDIEREYTEVLSGDRYRIVNHAECFRSHPEISQRSFMDRSKRLLSHEKA